MPYELLLSKKLRNAGWKAKVFDNEAGPEEPHFTIIRRMQLWRVSLRTGEFLVPPGGRWNDFPKELIAAISDEANLQEMKDYWDAGNPHNRIQSEGHEQGA